MYKKHLAGVRESRSTHAGVHPSTRWSSCWIHADAGEDWGRRQALAGEGRHVVGWEGRAQERRWWGKSSAGVQVAGRGSGWQARMWLGGRSPGRIDLGLDPDAERPGKPVAARGDGGCAATHARGGGRPPAWGGEAATSSARGSRRDGAVGWRRVGEREEDCRDAGAVGKKAEGVGRRRRRSRR